jgi:hypothetical protein
MDWMRNEFIRVHVSAGGNASLNPDMRTRILPELET